VTRVDALWRTVDGGTREAHDTLVLPLSALLILLYGFETPSLPLRVALSVVCGVLLLSPTLRRRPEPWTAASALLAGYVFSHWLAAPNHGFLVAYWALACALATTSDRPGEVLARNGRLLIGLSFLLAAVWKLRRPDFVDGTFFEYMIVTGEVSNVRIAAALLGGLSREQIARNDGREHAFLASPEQMVSEPLESTPEVQLFARLVSGWALLIEFAVAATFLLGARRVVGRLRDPLLLIFIYSSYLFFPIVLFAHVLAVMGLAQCPPGRRLARAGYLLSFPVVQLVRLV
jgi:hypothetical protein